MKEWKFFSPAQLKPTGWLKRQLEIQAAGLSGNLHKVWPDIRDSAWIGGHADGWERVPCWLDGFIPLAYLLERQDLIDDAKFYIDTIIAAQKPDGWICPCAQEDIPNYDTWVVQLFSKTLLVYYQCSEDQRIPNVLYKMLKNYYDLLSCGTIKLFDWGKYRWFETFFALNFLYQKYEEAWIIDLARILKEQGIDYSQNVNLWRRPINNLSKDTHIVNLAMMLKTEAITHSLLGEPYANRAEYFHKFLSCYNGTPVGSYTGDERLNGLSPIQGTELCGIVEQMHSFEQLFAHTGDSRWLERLELLAFNALPAAISDDMWTHQYDQMSNQIACVRFPRRPIFGTNGIDAHLFGLEPYFGCCTVNHSQGWPKFALSSFLYKDHTILSTLLLPTKLNTSFCCIELETDYPFNHKLTYTVSTQKDMTLLVRIPSFAKHIKTSYPASFIDGNLEIHIAKNQNVVIHIEFDVDVELIDRPHNLKTVRWGSLVFSVPVSYKKIQYEYTQNGVERKYPYCDYEYVGQSRWNYGYSDVTFDVVTQTIDAIPFSSQHPPITIKAKVTPIPWGLERGYDTVCAKIPESTLPIGEEETIELYPYGCAKLRMTELPLV